jgi:hypothetical protein
MGTAVLSLGAKYGWGVTLTTHHIQCRGEERVAAILLFSSTIAWSSGTD